MKGILSHHSILFAGLLVALLLPLAACTSAPTATPAPTPVYTITTTTKAGIGDYLVDSKGMTLYYFTKDKANDSYATEAIIAIWPVFYASNVAVPSNLKASDFGAFTRDDGKMQTTYKGWPLYYYSKDKVAGDTVGQGFNGIWFVVNPQSVPLPPSGS